MLLRAKRIFVVGTLMLSRSALTTSSFPLGPNPPIMDDIALELGTVAKMARAPPSFVSSAAASVAELSI